MRGSDPHVSQRKGEHPKRKRSNPEEVVPEIGQSQGCLPKRRNRWLGADLQIGTLQGKENTHQKEIDSVDGVILGIKAVPDGENTLRIESTAAQERVLWTEVLERAQEETGWPGSRLT